MRFMLTLLSWHNGVTARNCSFPDAVILYYIIYFILYYLFPHLVFHLSLGTFVTWMSMRHQNKNVFPVTQFLTPQCPRSRLKKLLEETSKAFPANKRTVSTNASCLEVFHLQIFPLAFEFELGLHNITKGFIFEKNSKICHFYCS